MISRHIEPLACQASTPVRNISHLALAQRGPWIDTRGYRERISAAHGAQYHGHAGDDRSR